MVELKKFPKLGVRVPTSLKRKVKQLVLDMDTAGVTFNDDELSMEAAFDVAMLELLSMSQAEQARIFGRRIPELMAMFEAEAPRARQADEPDGSRSLPGGGRARTVNPGPAPGAEPAPKKPSTRKGQTGS